jgi:hypothetical protein
MATTLYGNFALSSNASDSFLSSVPDDLMVFPDSNSQRMMLGVNKGVAPAVCVTSNGVGVANSNPQYPLDVVGNVNLNGFSISAGNLGMFRNRIINGDMRVNQRPASTSVTFGTTLSYPTDRWACQGRGSATYTLSTSNVSVPGYPFSTAIAAAVSVASTSSTSTDFYIPVYHVLEGYNIADFLWGTSSALPVTISFSLYTNVAQPLFLSVRNGSYNMSYVVSFTPTAGAWQQLKFTVPGPTSGTWATSNAMGLAVCISPFAGSTYQSPSSGTWLSGNYMTLSTNTTTFSSSTTSSLLLTGAQLEKGTLATPFEFRMYQVEMQLCRRYYVRFTPTSLYYKYPLIASCANSSIADVYYNHGGNFMRATNSALVVNINNVTNGYQLGTTTFSYIDGSTVQAASTGPNFYNDDQPYLFRVNGTVGASGGCLNQINTNGTTSGYIEISAEIG